VRLVLSRAAAARTLLVAATVTAAVTTTLLTAFALYVQLLPVAAARAAVATAPPAQRSLAVTSSAGRTPADLAERDAAVRDLLAGGLAGADVAVSAAGRAISQRLPDGLPGVPADPDGTYAVVAFLADLPAHAVLTDGAWPEPVPAGDPADVALPTELAGTLGLGVGDEVAIVDERGGLEPGPRPVVVAGLWAPIDPQDLFWQLTADINARGIGPFVVHPEEFAARYQILGTLEWLAAPDPDGLAAAGMAEVAAAVDALQADLAARRGAELDDSALLQTALGELAARLEVAGVVQRSGLVLPAVLLAVIAGYCLVLVARLLAGHRRGENALLRARGASRAQLVRITVAEALLVVTPAALVGGPAGAHLVVRADDAAGDRGLGLAADLARYGWVGPPVAWLIAVLAAAGCAAALALPAAGRGRTWVAEQQERSRPGKLAVIQRAGVDLALVALAVLAWIQLRQYGTAVRPAGAGGIGVDPLLVGAPVVGVLAATAISLRLLPLATRLGVRVTGRGTAFPRLLGMWQADRRPHAGPVLLLVLAVAAAVLAPGVAATWQRSQRDQAAHAVGADLRVDRFGYSVTLERAAATTRAAEAEGTGRAMPVHRATLPMPRGRTTLLALDAAAAPDVVLMRPDLSGVAPDAIFELLRAGRPELDRVALPAGARRLVGRVTFDAPPPVRYVGTLDTEGELTPLDAEIPAPVPGPLTAYLLDAYGVITAVPLVEPGGNLAEAGELDVDVPLPPRVVALVGIGMGVIAADWLGGFFAQAGYQPDPDPEPVEVSLHLADLATSDGASMVTELPLPAGWDLRRASGDTGPAPEHREGEPAVTLTLDPVDDYPHQGRYLFTGPVGELDAMPAVVTPDVLAATEAEVGQLLTLGDLTVRAVGSVRALPGTATGSGVAIDLPWWSAQRVLEMRPVIEANEWWLATDRPAVVAAAAREAGLTVRDRQETTRGLLDDPLGSGVLLSLWAAAAAATVLAAFGLAVDSRATAVRRQRELAVLHTLGASPGGLARALVVEQAVLAGLGVACGVLVGTGVAAAMAPSLVLTATGAVPVPAPLLVISVVQFAAPTVGLFAVAIALGALVARRVRRDVVTRALRIGED
jgi:hypothetical protein